MTTQSSRSKRSKLTAWLVVLVFAVPLALAIWLYRSSDHWDLATSNHGELILPPMTLPLLEAADHDEVTDEKWLIFFINSGECGDICRENIHYMRQSWLSVGKERDRVKRLVINTTEVSPALQEWLEAEYPGTQIEMLAVPSDEFILEEIYVADPIGNVILHYPPGTDPNGLYKDLKKLLKVSRIG